VACWEPPGELEDLDELTATISRVGATDGLRELEVRPEARSSHDPIEGRDRGCLAAVLVRRERRVRRAGATSELAQREACSEARAPEFDGGVHACRWYPIRHHVRRGEAPSARSPASDP
jgi:hypothetical protein